MGTIIVYLAFCLLSSNHQVSDFPLASEKATTGDIIVHVDKVTVNKGTLYLGLFDSKKTFRKIRKVYKFQQADTDSVTTTVTIKDVPFNEYALVIFQDYNENKKFDKTFMGFPKEPFGFSTNYRVKTSAPKYEDVLFQHSDLRTELNVVLQSL